MDNENTIEKEFHEYASIVKISDNASLWDFDCFLLMDELVSDIFGIGKLSENAIELLKEGKDTLEKIIEPVASPVWSELGLMIQDPVRRIRVEREINWLKRLGQAGKYVELSGLEYKPVDLKTINKLRELSSVEENVSLQDKWARLIASAATQGTLPPSSISILGEITPEEGRILDFMYTEIKNFNHKDQFEDSPSLNKALKASNVQSIDNLIPLNKAFKVSDLQSIDDLDEGKIKIKIDNLVRLNILRIGGIHRISPVTDFFESEMNKSSFDAFLGRTMRHDSLDNAISNAFKAMNKKIDQSIAKAKYDPDMIYEKVSLTPLGFECVTLWNGPNIPSA